MKTFRQFLEEALAKYEAGITEEAILQISFNLGDSAAINAILEGYERPTVMAVNEALKLYKAQA